MQKKIVVLIAFVALVVIGLSCTTTKFTGSWKDPSFSGSPYAKILVIGIFRQPGGRNLYEDIFAQQLKKRGIEAIPSHLVLPSDAKLTKDVIVQKVKEMGLDSVLLTRLVDSVTYQNIPGYYYNYWDYAQASNAFIIQADIGYLETNFYDAKTEKLVWSGSSTTQVGFESDEGVVHSATGAIANRMAEEHLIP
ncbi:MAG: hypothetical protein ACM34I_09785 [bacterium]